MKSYTLNYLYPFEDVNKCKIFKNSNSQIVSINFKRNKNIKKEIDQLKDVSFINNYSIYFLLNKSEENLKIYVGQTTKGIDRILEHEIKEFWEECYLFTTESNTWDKTIIDYLEYSFIQKVKDSGYELMNKDGRIKQPNINLFTKSDVELVIDEVLKLLTCNGITIENKFQIIENNDNFIYDASRNLNAKLMFRNSEFILLKGSEIKYPIETSKNWSDNGKFHERYSNIIDNFIKQGLVKLSDDTLILTNDIPLNSPSAAGALVSGYAENGWKFWVGLEELR